MSDIRPIVTLPLEIHSLIFDYLTYWDKESARSTCKWARKNIEPGIKCYSDDGIEKYTSIKCEQCKVVFATTNKGILCPYCEIADPGSSFEDFEDNKTQYYGWCVHCCNGGCYRCGMNGDICKPQKSNIEYTINEYIPERLNNKVWECHNCAMNRIMYESETNV